MHLLHLSLLLCGVPVVSLFCTSPEWTSGQHNQVSEWRCFFCCCFFFKIWVWDCKIRSDRKLTWMEEFAWSLTTDENYILTWVLVGSCTEQHLLIFYSLILCIAMCVQPDSKCSIQTSKALLWQPHPQNIF